MAPTFRLRATLALMLASFMLAAPATAGDDGKNKHKDKGDKHGKKHEDKQSKKDKKDKSRENDDVRVGGYFTEDHRTGARTYYTQQYRGGRACPPGLAKKNNGCMPPGQAKKWAVGQPLPREVVYYPVPQPVIVQLPPAPVGYRYVRVGNDILLLSPRSTIVVDVIINIFG